MVTNKKEVGISALIVVGIILLTILPGDLGFEGSGWISAQWGVTYVYGFIFRGFIGSILEVIDINVTKEVLHYIYCTVMAIYIGIVSCFSIKFYKKNQNYKSLLLIGILIVQPFITQWWFHADMIFRLDIFILVAFLLSLIVSFSCIKDKWKYILIFFISLFAMLIHEGYAVLFVPSIIASLMYNTNKNHGSSTNKINYTSIFASLIPLVIVYIMIVIFGKADTVDTTLLYTINSNIHKRVGLINVQELYYFSILDKINYTMNDFTILKLQHLIITIVLMTPSIYIIARLWNIIIRNTKVNKYIIFIQLLFTFSPVVCFFIGIDSMRWLGYILINNVFIVGAYIYTHSSVQKKVFEFIKKNIVLFIIAIILAIWLGPTSYVKGFKFASKIISYWRW